jgi:hypothetical protein
LGLQLAARVAARVAETELASCQHLHQGQIDVLFVQKQTWELKQQHLSAYLALFQTEYQNQAKPGHYSSWMALL